LPTYSVTVRTELVEVCRSCFDKLSTNGGCKCPKERARNNLSKFMLRQAQHERWWRLSCSSYFMHVPKLKTLYDVL